MVRGGGVRSSRPQRPHGSPCGLLFARFLVYYADMHIDVAALAKLVRLEVPEAELEKLEREIPDILKFVETIQQAAGEVKPEAPNLRNVMRPDENPRESGIYTERVLVNAPARKGDRIAVKQVVSRKK